MYTIFQNSNNTEHDFYSFKNQMIEICNNHRNNNKSLAFSFILYDFENTQLSKILKDQDYWLALNQISGEYLTVFSLHYNPEAKIKRPNIAPILLTVPTDWNPSDGTNKLIKKYFGKIDVNYPAILFFQVNGNSVIDSILIELKEEEIEKAFLELKEYIKVAVDSLKRISIENRQNYREVFDCLEREVESKQANRKIKRIIKNSGNIIGLISSIKGLF